MPEVCRFYGIIIRFYYREHPPTHFHAIYGEHEALIEIETGDVYRIDANAERTRLSRFVFICLVCVKVFAPCANFYETVLACPRNTRKTRKKG